MSLLNVPTGEWVRLISANDRLRVKLRPYGLHVGDRVRVLRSAPLGGPLLLEVGGRGIAEKIAVEVECGSC